MLAWLPIIGPIIEGIVSIFKSKNDTTVQLTKIDSDVRVAEVQASTQILHDYKDQIDLRVMRDIACLPWVVWSALIGWSTIVAKWHPELYIPIPAPPDSVAYLPGMVMVFLLGNIGFNIWKRS